MVGKRGCSAIAFIVCALLLMLTLSATVLAQGLPQSPYSAPSVVRGGLDLAPSNPFGMPGSTGGLSRGSDSIYLTDRMFRDILGPIPNLQVGYLYRFGSRYSRQSRLTLDYLLPVTFGDGNSALFGEAHGEFTNFWDTISSIWRRAVTTPTTITTTTTTRSSFNERTDLSFGGGYRTILNENTLLGVNGFFDTAKLGSRWYSSGGMGFEFAAILAGNDALDLTVNWYDNLFDQNALRDVFRRGPSNFDFQAGYSHELY
ncbi:inverse autotransporter beta domain-containing protein, partial [Thermodesulfobacteriota bacterium]